MNNPDEHQDIPPVEQGVPLPTSCVRRYPFREMSVGDSFLVSGTKRDFDRLRASASQHARRTKRRYTVRKVGEGEMRCWRIE